MVCYLLLFENEGKYSIAQRMVACEDSELVIGALLKVKDKGKYYLGKLISSGTKEQMDAVLNPHENINKTPDSNKKTKKGGKAEERDRDDGRRKRKISSSDESVLLDQYVSEKKRITIASNGY